MNRLVTLILATAGIGLAIWFVWNEMQPATLDGAFASGNGRIEATEIDVATKYAGRVIEILASEGDFVTVGQAIARMDTEVLEAELAEAEAQLRKSQSVERTAQAMVTLRKSEKVSAEAVVKQREAELTAAERQFKRSETVARNNPSAISETELDDDRVAMLSAQAALAASQAQVASAVAAIEAAKSQVIEAESGIEAARAVINRVKADIKDSLLTSPRDGRVQYRVAEPGEVLPAGGTVLNLVDLSDVYMTFFLPTAQAGRVELGQEVRLVLDALPHYVVPAKVSYVANVAQFTPKTVETAIEREKLMFRVKARIPKDLLKEHITQVKTGLPGMAYLRLDDSVPWPAELDIKEPS